jgi:hypothetical protein
LKQKRNSHPMYFKNGNEAPAAQKVAVKILERFHLWHYCIYYYLKKKPSYIMYSLVQLVKHYAGVTQCGPQRPTTTSLKTIPNCISNCNTFDILFVRMSGRGTTQKKKD